MSIDLPIDKYCLAGRWRVGTILKRAKEIDAISDKIEFLQSMIHLISITKGKGRKRISVGAADVIKKLEKYIIQLCQEENVENEFIKRNHRLNWTDDPESLIYLFYQLKNNVLGRGNKPLLDNSNIILAEFIKDNFNVSLSVETIFNKLNSPSSYLESREAGSLAVYFLVSRVK